MAQKRGGGTQSQVGPICARILSTPADARSVDRASEESFGANSFPGEEAYAMTAFMVNESRRAGSSRHAKRRAVARTVPEGLSSSYRAHTGK